MLLKVPKFKNFILLLLLTCIGVVQAYADFQPPKIYPQTPAGHILVQAGQTAKLICRGTLKGVSWFLPTDASDSLRRRLVITPNTDHRYFESQIQIRDLNYTDTGTLVCAYNGTTDLTSIDNSSKIHLYVEDKKHILKESGFDYMQAIQSETFVLPCMPTHPDVNLSLWRGGQRVNDKYITFDPKVGYRISPVIAELHSGFFECKASYMGRSDSYTIDVTVRPKTSFVPPPHINMTMARRVMKGDAFSLTCSVMVDFNTIVELTWRTPNPRAIDDHRLNVPLSSYRNLSLPGTHLRVVEQGLTVQRSKLEDQGTYTCTVTDHAGNSQSKSQFVRIMEGDEPRLLVYYDGFQTIDKSLDDVNDNKAVQWVVQIVSHPQPTVEWFSPDGRKIDPRARGEYTVKTYLERENSRTVLRVNKPKLSNLGTYTLKVTNGNLSRTENFTLIVRSKPIVRTEVVNPQGLYSQGHEYTIKCVAEGYPIPTINWYFKPCSTFIDCNRERSDSIRQRLNHRITNTHSSVSVIKEVARRSGQITCQACNPDCVYQSVDFFVTDIPDGGFTVNGPENVLVGEAISLKCSASKYNFSQDSIEWFKDSLHGAKKLVTDQRYKVDMTSSKFSFTKELTVLNVTLGDKGRYFCQVNRIEDRRTPMASRRRSYSRNNDLDENSSQLSFHLNVLPLEPPVFITTNLVPLINDDTMPLIVQAPEDGIELFCKVHGRPRPMIKWFLNGQILKPTLNTTRVQILEDHQVVRINYVSAKDEGLYECKAENTVGYTKATHLVQLKSTAELDAMYAQISLPVIIAVVIALLVVILLLVIAKICYMKRQKKTSSVSTTPEWKEPSTPPTPRLTNYNEYNLNTSGNTPTQNMSEEEECRVTLTGSVSPMGGTLVRTSRHLTPHPPHYLNSEIYGHCHYNNETTTTPSMMHTPQGLHSHDPLLQFQQFSICDCSAQTLPQGTLERQFPHLYPPPSTRSNNCHAATMHRSYYGQGHHQRSRSHSHSPSRRSAEY